MSDCCDGKLDVADLQVQQRKVLIWVLLINVASFAFMVVGSVLSGSSALLSGTLDNLGDALTYGLSLAVVGASCAAKARVALFKGLLIAAAAVIVAAQVVWHISNLQTPIVETMSIAAVANLAANLVCLMLLTPHRHSDVNMASVWECSRNDIFDGVAVIVAAALVWLFDSPWPDIIVASALVVLFSRSATRVLRSAWLELYPASAS